ncbi:MAG: thiamine pyrophosphate-dependent enzyme [Proteobacteria bacterium]|nr:thiamine pyrophosphate-dependent enzyme [Pseudomonadota bacterium]
MIKDVTMEVMIGNYAIARGLVEAGLEIATAYPGTPSSEIIPGIIEFNRREKGNILTEWSVNERCALEAAFGAASAGKKAACMMKQVGLNVAFPPLLNARRKRLKGALVIISCDDPGPQSSQTEQDTRLLATLFDIPVFDPASPKEASDVAYFALQYSIEKHTPVILRSTHRVSHSREAVPLYPPGTRHVVLMEGVSAPYPVLNAISPAPVKLGIIASGMSYSIVSDVISELGLETVVPVYKVIKIPNARPPVPGQGSKSLEQENENIELYKFIDNMNRILVLEEPDTVLEALIDNGNKIYGRSNGYVPDAGELTYDIVRDVVGRTAADSGIRTNIFTPDPLIDESLKGVQFSPRPPKLCAGCSHRASFFAMRQAYPEAIFPGDIGCYTLGISQGAVDTCLDMGSGVTMASGFYDTINQDGEIIPILASVGDSTFFHACLSPLYDAVKKQKRFILVIMDNGTTAMTGMQPTPQTGIMADGTQGRRVLIENIIEGFGVEFLKILDPYDIPHMINTIKEAKTYLSKNGNGPAVIIARRECLLHTKVKYTGTFDRIALEEDCIGCKRCIKLLDCPAMLFNDEKHKVVIDEGLCAECGMCLVACSIIRPKKKE